MVSPTVVDFGGDPDRSDRNDAAKVAAQADRSFSGQHRMAFRLAGRYAGRLLFVPDVGWHRWDSRRWATDGDRAAERAVDVVLGAAVRDGAGDAALRADVRKCESATGRKGVLDIAGSLLDLVCAADKLDADPHLLNARNGTLDLRTMEMHPHNPQDRITKVCAAAYDPDTESPTGRWERFLTEVLPDAEVRGFLARLIGLSLLGAVRENVLPIWTGLGANGKGAAYNAILHALGDYACPADPDLFMARDGAHPTGTMDLRGRRFVVVSESDKHKRMNEATMKRLTGGDPIKSRFMGKNFVTFTPVAPSGARDESPAEGCWGRCGGVAAPTGRPVRRRDPEARAGQSPTGRAPSRHRCRTGLGRPRLAVLRLARPPARGARQRHGRHRQVPGRLRCRRPVHR